MADALTVRGLDVTLAGKNDGVLPTVDAEFGALIENEFCRHGVEVVNAVEVGSIRTNGTRLQVSGSRGFETSADVVVVVVAAGVKPATELAISANITVGKQGAIRVDRGMRTEVQDVYAAGDCVETWHRLLTQYVYLPLGHNLS